MIGAVACAWSGTLPAAQVEYSLGYLAEYSDNVTRIADDREGVSELINTANVRLSYIENTSSFNAHLLGSAAYDNYYNSTFENQTQYFLDAYGELFYFRRTLSWVAADGFRRLQIDPLQPDTPTNQQNSNAWATGPNVYLRIGNVDSLVFEGRYGRSWVENMDVDSQRWTYAGRWLHRTSARTTFSLNFEYLSIDFENDVANADLIRQNYFLRTDIRDLRNQFTVDLGRTRIEQNYVPPGRDWLVRLSGAMRFASASTVGARYRREFTDSGGEILPGAVPSQTPGGAAAPALNPDSATSDPYYLEEADLYYSHRGTVFPWTIRLIYRDLDYQTVPDDRQVKGVVTDLRYLLGNTVTIQLMSTYNIHYYEQLVREDRESIVGTRLGYRITQNLEASLGFRRYGRRSTAPGEEYTDDRVTFSLMYGSGPATH